MGGGEGRGRTWEAEGRWGEAGLTGHSGHSGHGHSWHSWHSGHTWHTWHTWHSGHSWHTGHSAHAVGEAGHRLAFGGVGGGDGVDYRLSFLVADFCALLAPPLPPPLLTIGQDVRW